MDTEGLQVLSIPITLPMGAQIDLEIMFEGMPEYCDVCHRLGHKTRECNDCNSEHPSRAKQHQQHNIGQPDEDTATPPWGGTNHLSRIGQR